MNFLFQMFPSLPMDPLVIIMNMIAMAGATLHIYGVFLETEKRRDVVFVVGGVCLFIYAMWVGNKIFMLAMAGFTLGSLIEIIEIMTGHHKHSLMQIENYGKNK